MTEKERTRDPEKRMNMTPIKKEKHQKRGTKK